MTATGEQTEDDPQAVQPAAVGFSALVNLAAVGSLPAQVAGLVLMGIGGLVGLGVGALLFAGPAGFVGWVAGSRLGRRGVVALLPPLVGVGILALLSQPFYTDPIGTLPSLGKVFAFLVAPYAIGWVAGWVVKVRRAGRTETLATPG